MAVLIAKTSTISIATGFGLEAGTLARSSARIRRRAMLQGSDVREVFGVLRELRG